MRRFVMVEKMYSPKVIEAVNKRAPFVAVLLSIVIPFLVFWASNRRTGMPLQRVYLVTLSDSAMAIALFYGIGMVIGFAKNIFNLKCPQQSNKPIGRTKHQATSSNSGLAIWLVLATVATVLAVVTEVTMQHGIVSEISIAISGGICIWLQIRIGFALALWINSRIAAASRTGRAQRTRR